MNKIKINSKNTINASDIVFLKGSINYSVVYYKNGSSEVLTRTLKYLESQLEQLGFYRIHKSFLVNLEYIDNVPKGSVLFIKQTYSLSVSRRRKSGLKRKLEKRVSISTS